MITSGSWKDTDKVLIVPLVGRLHGAGVVGGDGGGADAEHSLVLPLPRVLRDHEGANLARQVSLDQIIVNVVSEERSVNITSSYPNTSRAITSLVPLKNQNMFTMIASEKYF